MRIAAIRIPWAAVLILFAAQLGFLAPRTALAHEGAHQAGQPETGRGNAAHASFTTPCPDGSGHSCGCGNLDVLARDGGTHAVAGSVSRPGVSIPASHAKRSDTETLFPAACLLAHAKPRAPPSGV